MIVRHLILQFIILSLSLPALCSCKEDDGPDAPGTPPGTPADAESGLHVSFTGKHFRLADGLSYDGDIISSWVDTVWQNDRPYNQLLIQATDIDIEGLSLYVSALSNQDYEIAADSNKYKYMDLPIGSEEFASVFTTFLSDFASHLRGNGWFERTVLYMDENSNDETRTIVNFIRTQPADWKIGLSGRYIDADVERNFYNYSTIIGTTHATTAVSVPLFYTSCSQLRPNCYLTPLTSPAEMTWMAWHAMANGFKGYQRWAYDYWTRPDVFDARDRANTAGDFHMIYRSSNLPDAKPVNSIRMHMLRDGIQDYEKARIIGHQKLRTVMRDFSDSGADNAAAAVKRAQSEIKKLSSK